MKVTAIFDIGKTNKKFFLFDEKFQQVHKEYIRLPEIQDEDGHPTEDLKLLTKWLKSVFKKILKTKKYKVEAINFSTYGASLVHLDKEGNPLTPLYNYTKPYDPKILNEFYKKHGGEMKIASATASPPLKMLNAGLQLFWIKKTQPKTFQKIKYSLHFPQYLSYLFTGLPVSEFTSIGCHTALWDFEKGDYHNWVYKEKIDGLLPPIVPTSTSINMNYKEKSIRIGVGIHDSSAALLPYLRADKKPFLLISTGTWSIALNPFSNEILTQKDLENDCLNYMRIDGKSVKAARLFLGNEYQLQVEKLRKHFNKKSGHHRKVVFNKKIYFQQATQTSPLFYFESIQLPRQQPKKTMLSHFQNFENAFHRLLIELMDLQIEAAKRAIGKTNIKKIYVDGGFADNDIFIKLASYHFKKYKLRTTQSPLGSALGAAIVISNEDIKSKFLKKHYAMQKHSPLILEQ